MYNDFNYISAEVIVAEVKQRLKSYFDSGSLNEALIPTYIDNGLRKLKRLVLDLKDDIITVDNYKAKLPSDFAFLKDAYSLRRVEHISTPIMTTKFEYYKKVYCNDTCNNEYETFESTSLTIPSWITTHLKPCLLRVYYGSRNFCTPDCSGLSHNSIDVVKINGKTITTTFKESDIYIQYWTKPEDDYGPMIPEIIEVEEYLKACLFYHLFEDLYNSVTDESVNIIERKLGMYRQEYYNKFQAALNVLKQETLQETRDNIHKQNRRFVRFSIT